MNRSHQLFAAALVIAAAFASTGRAHATSRPYGAAANAAPQMFCAMPAQTGAWTAAESRYASSGQCEVLQAQQPSNTNGRSEFPDVAVSTELAHATWSAIGTYDVATKKVVETIVVPPPPANQPPRQIQVYGLFTLQMTCTADPWLDTLATCSAIRYSSNANGHLGALGDMFKKEARPLSSRNEPNHQALLDANRQRMQALAQLKAGMAPAQAAISAARVTPLRSGLANAQPSFTFTDPSFATKASEPRLSQPVVAAPSPGSVMPSAIVTSQVTPNWSAAASAPNTTSNPNWATSTAVTASPRAPSALGNR